MRLIKNIRFHPHSEGVLRTTWLVSTRMSLQLRPRATCFFHDNLLLELTLSITLTSLKAAVYSSDFACMWVACVFELCTVDKHWALGVVSFSLTVLIKENQPRRAGA